MVALLIEGLTGGLTVVVVVVVVFLIVAGDVGVMKGEGVIAVLIIGVAVMGVVIGVVVELAKEVEDVIMGVGVIVDVTCVIGLIEDVDKDGVVVVIGVGDALLLLVRL